MDNAVAQDSDVPTDVVPLVPSIVAASDVDGKAWLDTSSAGVDVELYSIKGLVVVG